MSVKILWETLSEDSKDDLIKLAMLEIKELALYNAGMDEEMEKLVEACELILKFVTIPANNTP